MTERKTIVHESEIMTETHLEGIPTETGITGGEVEAEVIAEVGAVAEVGAKRD